MEMIIVDSDLNNQNQLNMMSLYHREIILS